jgi:hypothetical protein
MFRLARMFKSSSSVLSSVRCPKIEDCNVPNCVFSHDQKRKLTSSSSSNDQAVIKKQKTVAVGPPPISEPSALRSIVDKIAGFGDNEGTKKDLLIAAPSPLSGVGAPAKYQQRVRFIDALMKAYVANNVPLPKKTAVERELAVASTSSNITYGPNMQSLVRNSRRGGDTAQVNTKKNTKFMKKTLTSDEKFKAVKALVHSVSILERNGYVVKVPDITDEYRSVEICNRCQENFEMKDITDKTKCAFHERKRYVHNNNRHWECCDQIIGESQGCKTADHHVFKAKTGTDLQKLIPFVESPEPKVKGGTKKIIGLDCEMGYTTKGLELLRLTVLDFYTGKSLFDEVIKPYGIVLDLNTQWSGVSSIPEDSMTLAELNDVLFNSLIDKETIIIGHGLENDLNTLRLIHHNVVDTSILYPKGLSNKFSLKDLSFDLLDRKIQSGEHSSEEDSLAAIDIVKAHILK